MSEKLVSITLAQAIALGGTALASITLRKPGPGELRGLSLSQLISGDVDQHLDLLPRITIPPIPKAVLLGTDPETNEPLIDTNDFSEMVNEAVGFLLPTSQKPVRKPKAESVTTDPSTT